MSAVVPIVESCQAQLQQLLAAARELFIVLNNDALYEPRRKPTDDSNIEDPALNEAKAAKLRFDELASTLNGALNQLEAALEAEKNEAESPDLLLNLQAQHDSLSQRLRLKTNVTKQLLSRLRVVQLHVLNMTSLVPVVSNSALVEADIDVA